MILNESGLFCFLLCSFWTLKAKLIRGIIGGIPGKSHRTMPPMPLTDTIIKNVKYTRDDGKPQREYDEGGLYLEITPKGKKKWQLKYRRPVTGKESRLSFGMYPLVSLKEARTKRDEAKKLLAQQIDPGEAKKEDKRLAILQSANTIQAIANEWLSKQVHLAEVTRNKNEWLLNFAFADFGHKPITDVTSPDLLAVCRKLEAKSNIETAHRVRSKCGQVFRYAIATGHATYDPSQALRGALQPVVVNHRPAITDPALVATLMQAITGYQGYG